MSNLFWMVIVWINQSVLPFGRVSNSANHFIHISKTLHHVTIWNFKHILVCCASIRPHQFYVPFSGTTTNFLYFYKHRLDTLCSKHPRFSLCFSIFVGNSAHHWIRIEMHYRRVSRSYFHSGLSMPDWIDFGFLRNQYMFFINLRKLTVKTWFSGIVFAKLIRSKHATHTVQFSKNAVITRRGRSQCFMFRIGDLRKSRLAGVNVRAILLKTERTTEGEVLQSYQNGLS